MRSLTAAILISAALLAPAALRAASTPLPPAMVARLQAAELNPNGYAFETYDDGLPPVTSLRLSDFDAATPTTVPGAKTITTAELRDMLVTGAPLVLLDVLFGVTKTLPGAYWLQGAGAGGTFDDQIQARLRKKLAALTGGNMSIPIVVFCLGPSCWNSPNVALRLVKLGYTVLWYRGGHEAWAEAGLPLVPAKPEPW